jgi:hypothetical protein
VKVEVAHGFSTGTSARVKIMLKRKAKLEMLTFFAGRHEAADPIQTAGFWLIRVGRHYK